MADDTTADAIAISTGVVGALRAAGVLLQEVPTGTQPPPPPPPPPRAVGDTVNLAGFRRVGKIVTSPDPSGVTRFTISTWPPLANYALSFPPNETRLIPELERLVTASLTRSKGILAHALLEITHVFNDYEYQAKLQYLSVYGELTDP